jgi:hypothetical protein
MGFRGAVDVVAAIVVLVEVLVLLVAVGTPGCPPGTVVVVEEPEGVDATVVVDRPAVVVLVVPVPAVVLDEAATVVVDVLVASIDEVEGVSLGNPSESVVAVVAAVVGGEVTAAAAGSDVVGAAAVAVVDGRFGGPSGTIVVAGVVSAVVGVGVGPVAAMAGAAAMRAVPATETRERSSRLDIATMIPGRQLLGRG